MAKKKLRKIVVDGQEYLWKFTAAYVCTDEATRSYRCSDWFTAYAANDRSCPMHVHFETWEDAAAGGPLRYGGEIVLGNISTAGVNLYTPRWAATLIHYALEQGWKPGQCSQPFFLSNGTDILATLQYIPYKHEEAGELR